MGDLTDSDSAESDNSDNDSSDDQNEHGVISHMEINNEQISQINSIGSQDFLFDYSSNDIFTYLNL